MFTVVAICLHVSMLTFANYKYWTKNNKNLIMALYEKSGDHKSYYNSSSEEHEWPVQPISVQAFTQNQKLQHHGGMRGKVIRIHCLETKKVCTKCCANLLGRWRDIHWISINVVQGIAKSMKIGVTFSWQFIQYFSGYFTQNQNCKSCGGARGKVRSSSKPLRIHPLGTTNVCTKVEPLCLHISNVFDTGIKHISVSWKAGKSSPQWIDKLAEKLLEHYFCCVFRACRSEITQTNVKCHCTALIHGWKWS